MSGQDFVREALRDCQQALAAVGTLSMDERPSAIVDFKARQRAGLRIAVFTSIDRLRNNILSSGYESRLRARLLEAVSELEKNPSVVRLQRVSELLPVGVVGQDESSVYVGKIQFNSLPMEIRHEMRADADELEKCMAHQCFRSAVIICGRLLETALHRKYFEATGNDLLEKAPGIGLGNVIAKLQEHGAHLDPALANQVHLINQVRIWSVHKKQDPFNPSKAQAQAIVLYTMDVVEKLFAIDGRNS